MADGWSDAGHFLRSHEIFLYQRRVIASRVLETWGAEPPSSLRDEIANDADAVSAVRRGWNDWAADLAPCDDRFAISSPGPRFHMILGCDETR